MRKKCLFETPPDTKWCIVWCLEWKEKGMIERREWFPKVPGCLLRQFDWRSRRFAKWLCCHYCRHRHCHSHFYCHIVVIVVSVIDSTIARQKRRSAETMSPWLCLCWTGTDSDRKTKTNVILVFIIVIVIVIVTVIIIVIVNARQKRRWVPDSTECLCASCASCVSSASSASVLVVALIERQRQMLLWSSSSSLSREKMSPG